MAVELPGADDFTEPSPVYARPARRFAACLIDSALVGLPAALIIKAMSPDSREALLRRPDAGVLMLVWVACFALLDTAYYTALIAWRGQTLGKLFTGVKVVSLDGRLPSVWRALVRTLADDLLTLLWLALVGLVDPLLILLRRDRRSLHDMAAGTIAISVAPSRGERMIALVAAVVLLSCYAGGPGALLSLTVTRSTPGAFSGADHSGGVWLTVSGTKMYLYRVMSGNMAPTLREGELVLAYEPQRLRRGDIIAHGPPRFTSASQDTLIVNRVIGKRTDSLSIHDGTVWIRGMKLTEPYLCEGIGYRFPDKRTKYLRSEFGRPEKVTNGRLRVPWQMYLVLGDNRNEADDSHVWKATASCPVSADAGLPMPFLEEKRIFGRVVFVAWPLGHARCLNGNAPRPLPDEDSLGRTAEERQQEQFIEGMWKKVASDLHFP